MSSPAPTLPVRGRSPADAALESYTRAYHAESKRLRKLSCDECSTPKPNELTQE